MNDLKIKLSLDKILATDNVASLIDDDNLNKIGGLVQSTYKEDKASCSEEFRIKEEVMDLAMQDVTPRENKPNSVIPLIYAAAQRFNADAYPALMRDGRIVKPKVIGSDDEVVALDDQGEEVIKENGQKDVVLEAGKKLEKGERIAEYENFLLANHLTEWQEDEDKLLFALAILGDMFKKTYYDPYKKRTISEIKYPLDVVVNINATNMEDYPVSEKDSKSQNAVRQRILTKEYIKYEMSVLLGNDEDGDKKVEDTDTDYDKEVALIEQHRLLDLDGDGYKEPYTVTIANSKVLKIARRFDKEDIVYHDKKTVLEIKANLFFTHRVFIPNPKGTFYSIGYGYILRKINKTVNSTVNQLIEAGINSNMVRGFIDSSIKLKGGDLTLKQGEWKIVNGAGVSIKDNIIPLPSKEPSMALYQLMVFLIDTAKQLSGITDVLGGNIPSNMQPTTALAAIEQGLKEFKAIYKRQYKGLTEEIKKIHKIIKNNPERYAEEYQLVLDDNEADFKKDFQDENLDIQLNADTDVVTNIERVAKSNFLMQFIGNQQMNQPELLKSILAPMRIENIKDLVIEPVPNQPDPMQEMMKKQQEIDEMKMKIALQDSNRQLSEATLKGLEAKYKAQKTIIDMEKVEAEVENTRADTMTKLASIPNDRAKLQMEADKLYEPPQKANESNTNGTKRVEGK